MTTQALVNALLQSLKTHIAAIWKGDEYDYEGNLVQAATCPSELESMLQYIDSDSVVRILGPQRVIVGRWQDDMDLSNKPAVPSVRIELYHHDPDNIETWRDSTYAGADGAQAIAYYPIEEVGGEHMMHRRFVAKMLVFMVDSDQLVDEASRLGEACAAFLCSILDGATTFSWTWDMKEGTTLRAPITDPFNERPWRISPVISHTRLRGGMEGNILFDVKVYFEIVTSKS